MPRLLIPNLGESMTKVLVLYYSTYGHLEKLAQAAAEGAGSIPRTEVTVKRVPELMPPEMARTAGVKLDQAAPIATPAELADYDAILIGTPTRYGRMASQMANFLDQTGSLWASNALWERSAAHSSRRRRNTAARRRRCYRSSPICCT